MRRDIPDGLRCRQTYSTDLRERVVYQRMTLKFKIDQIATSLKMSRRVVERVLKLWRGEVSEPGPRRSGKRCRVMDSEEMEVSSLVLFSVFAANMHTLLHQFLLALVERKPDIYLDELQTQLQQQHGLVVGLSTIWDTLVDLGLTRKKVSRNSVVYASD